MTRHADGGNGPSQDEIYRCLSHHRRRRILYVLTERSAPITDTALATRIAADESTTPLVDGPTNGTESVLLDLRHAQLPMLERAGLLEWDCEGRTVASAELPVLEEANPRLATHLQRLDPGWDRVVSSLAHRRRRIALSVVANHGGPIDVSELARAIVERDEDGTGERDQCSNTTASHERVLGSLHHKHLPMLEDARFLAYDRDAGTVTFHGRFVVELELDRVDDERRRDDRTTRVPVPL